MATGPAASTELAADALLLAGASAVAEEEHAGGRVRLTADPPATPELPPGWTFEVCRVPPGAGLDDWRAHARPIRAGTSIILQPPWLEAASTRPGDVVVLLDPGHAFGSGSHPTTRLALAAIERTVRAGDRVLDVGCGSGVLAVTALLLGASTATGTDIDPNSLVAAADVASANGVSRRLEITSTPVSRVPGRFDVVVANLPAVTLLELATPIMDRVDGGGRLVLAGFLDERLDDVRAAYGRLAQDRCTSEDGWSALVLRATSDETVVRPALVRYAGGVAELLEQHRRALAGFGERVRAIGDDQWRDPTPCTDWDVRDLVNHVLVEQLWLPPLVEGARIEDVGDRFDGDQLGDDPVRSWSEAADAAASALREPGVLDRTVHLSYGDRDARGYLLEMTADLVVHTWDLARAIGAEETLPADLVELVHGYAEPHVDAMVASGLFDPPLSPPEGADAQTRLLALFGRRSW